MTWICKDVKEGKALNELRLVKNSSTNKNSFFIGLCLKGWLGNSAPAD